MTATYRRMSYLQNIFENWSIDHVLRLVDGDGDEAVDREVIEELSAALTIETTFRNAGDPAHNAWRWSNLKFALRCELAKWAERGRSQICEP